MPIQCPERDAGQSHDYDAGYCVYCDGLEPAPVERVNTDPDDAPDAWLDMALEDALSGGMYS